MFQYFDKDDNGSVDAEEIFTQAVSLGLAVTKAQVTGAMAARKEKTLGGQEEKELTFDQFLSILTCTDRYCIEFPKITTYMPLILDHLIIGYP